MSLFGCQPDEPLASLVTTNSIINVNGFLVVIMLLMYSVLHCLYSVEYKSTTTTTTTTTTTITITTTSSTTSNSNSTTTTTSTTIFVLPVSRLIKLKKHLHTISSAYNRTNSGNNMETWGTPYLGCESFHWKIHAKRIHEPLDVSLNQIRTSFCLLSFYLLALSTSYIWSMVFAKSQWIFYESWYF